MTSSARPSFDRAVLLFIYEVIVIDINWEHIKAEYLIGGISQRDLAKKHGVSFNTLKDVANKEQWKSLQTEIKAIATTKAQQLLIDDEVEQQLKLHNIRGQLIDILLDKIKTDRKSVV